MLSGWATEMELMQGRIRGNYKATEASVNVECGDDGLVTGGSVVPLSN